MVKFMRLRLVPLVTFLFYLTLSLSIDAQSLQQKMETLAHPLLKLQMAQIIPAISAEEANRLFLQSQFKRAFQANLPWAQQGNIRAILEIGFMYEFGRGVKKDYRQAALWYSLVFTPNAYNKKPIQRGLNYFFGTHDHRQDYRKAAQWIRMASELSIDQY